MTVQEIITHYPDVQIYEGSTNEGLKIAIIRGGLRQSNPKSYMDLVVSDYVEHRSYNEYIEEFLDNPWVRIIIEGIDGLSDDVWKSGNQI